MSDSIVFVVSCFNGYNLYSDKDAALAVCTDSPCANDGNAHGITAIDGKTLDRGYFQIIDYRGDTLVAKPFSSRVFVDHDFDDDDTVAEGMYRNAICDAIAGLIAESKGIDRYLGLDHRGL